MRTLPWIGLCVWALLQPRVASAVDALFEAAVKAEVEYAAADKGAQVQMAT